LKKLLKKHKNQVKQIYTTVGIWSTSQPVILQRIRMILLRGGVIMLEKLGIKREVKVILQKLRMLKK